MTNNQSIIDAAKEAGFEVDKYNYNTVLIKLTKFAELTLKRNGDEAVEPFKYLVQRFIEGMHEKDEYFDTKESAYENARWGFNETKVTPLFLSPPQPKTVASALEQAASLILPLLNEYRLTFTQDDDGNSYPLVDALTPPNDKNISNGQQEIEYLADYIGGGITALIANPTQAQVPQSVNDYVIALEALVNTLKPKYGDVGTRDVEVTAKLNAIKELQTSRPKCLASAPNKGE